MFERDHNVLHSGAIDARDLAWRKLECHAREIRLLHLSQLLASDSSRFKSCSRRLGPLLLDFSKQRLTDTTLKHLEELADGCDLRRWIDRLFAGDKINTSEQRSAMHWVLRLPPDSSGTLVRDVQAELKKMAGLVQRLRDGNWHGLGGERIRDVVNIGVGGSDTGPRLVCHALDAVVVPQVEAPRLHFVSTMDGSQLAQLLPGLRPQTTLFVLSSKSFTTVDTLANAATARRWLGDSLGNDKAVLRQHWIGISASGDNMTAWGIDPAHQLRLWDWVGGRFSLWSTIGFMIALRIGMDGFRQLLAGAHLVDEHFRTSPWHENIPVLMALTGIWNRNFLDIHNHAILPYDGRLKCLPEYLSQLEMESNGKSVTRDGKPVEAATTPLLWGEVGPNAQHAFYQFLHQGTEPVSSDFIAAVRQPPNFTCAAELAAQHELTLANCLAQSRLLALGNAAAPGVKDELSHRRYPGNQPSNTLLLDELTAFNMGVLLAVYEHKVFTQAMIWRINPFDQWGVEMGKSMAGDSLAYIREGLAPDTVDASTAGLVAAIAAFRHQTAPPGVSADAIAG